MRPTVPIPGHGKGCDGRWGATAAPHQWPRWHSSIRRPRLWSRAPGRAAAPLASAPQQQLRLLGELGRLLPPPGPGAQRSLTRTHTDRGGAAPRPEGRPLARHRAQLRRCAFR